MEQQPEHLNVMFPPKYAVPVFGYTVPPLVLAALVTTFYMVRILVKRHMRSPPNTLLICIAISNTITISLPVIPFTYFYTFGYYEDFIPFAWCRAFFYLVHVFPLMSNMASLWSTVALAFMRCYSVWRPLHAKSTITQFRTYIAIAAIYTMSVLVYIPTMFEYTYLQLSSQSLMEPNTTLLTCHLQRKSMHLSENFCLFHTWIQIIFTSLLPWFLITFPDFGLLYKLKKREDNREALCDETIVRNIASKESRVEVEYKAARTAGLKKTTWMIFVVVSMIWIVEIPFAISFSKYLSHSAGDVMHTYLGGGVVFVFLLKYITYPVVFFIYCLMSQKFRSTFKGILCCKSEIIHSPQTTKKCSSSTKESSSTKKLKTSSLSSSDC